MISFGDKLLSLRLKAGLSQLELAERAGMSVHGMAHLEAGHRQRPFWSTVVRLSRALGVPTDTFAECCEASLPTNRHKRGTDRVA